MSDEVCNLKVLAVDMHVLPMRTRFPFRYGIASLSALPHLFVRVELDAGTAGQSHGFASDGLPPKWFTKNPATSAEQDLVDMIAVIQHAAQLAKRHGTGHVTFAGLISRMRQDQAVWSEQHGHPPLLYNFGISLIERAMLDALCKCLRTPLHHVVRTPVLGVAWAVPPDEFLPESPSSTLQVRHTVGLADPIRVEDIPEGERLHDGLPQALEECIPACGLRYFKIKLCGDLEKDQPRLRAITETLEALCDPGWKATLDGNEQFHDMDTFRAYFGALRRDPSLAALLERTLWVEQPIHRDQALADTVGRTLHDWTDAPPLIIDESDGGTGDARRALSLGYVGTSHKNCKGVLKGLANAALLHEHRLAHPKKPAVISGEDLVNVGPIALLQDLAVQALLGVGHVERNGHHYFRGLDVLPPALAAETEARHPDLYATRSDGLITLRISEGCLDLSSVNAAPFGSAVVPDLANLPTLKQWILQGGLADLANQQH